MLDALSIVLVMSTILKPCPNTALMESSLMAREPFYRFTLCPIRCSKKSALKTTLTSFSDSMFIAINRYPFFWNSLQLPYFQFNAKFTPAEFPLMRHFKERVYLGVETITKLDFQDWLKSWSSFTKLYEFCTETTPTSKSTFSHKPAGLPLMPIQPGKKAL